MKKALFTLACITALFTVSACGSGEKGPAATPTPWVITATPTPTNTPTLTPTPTNTPTPTPIVDIFDGEAYFAPSTSLEKKLAQYYNDFFVKGLLSTGNTYRLRQKLEKAQKGEETIVCYLGGSVTEGEGSSERTPQGYKKGYAYMSYEYIRDTYGKGDNVKYVNAAISGTGSDLGVVRADEDVLSYNPDIIFIEFAVNNDTSIFNKMTYEGLVRKCLQAENEPAVVLLFSDATYAGSTQVYMKAIGTNYELPMVSVRTGLETPKAREFILWSDFSADTVHPKTDGHKLYAKLIAYMLKKSMEDTSHTEYVFNENASVKAWATYETTTMIDHNDDSGAVVETGCFTAERTNFSSTGNSDNHALLNGWTRKANSGSDGLKVDITCQNFVIVTKCVRSSKETSLDVYVDGELKKTINTTKSDAWNQPITTLIINSDDVKHHEIVIKPTAGSEGTAQTILALAYTK